MLVFSRVIIIFVLSVLMIACGLSSRHVNYSYEPPETERGQFCVSQCEEAKEACIKYCKVKSSKECLQDAKKDASIAYQRYVARQRKEGEPITKSESSFYDTEQCRAQACHCEEEYRSCYQLCGGSVVSS